jgi:enamine deaminase RidA (YjgF/YER057c/UK114 family)
MSIAPRDEPESSEVVAVNSENWMIPVPEIVLPEGWPSPRGYANGAIATGRILTLSGQVGWNPVTMAFESDDFVQQTQQALHNIVELLLAANARPHDLVRLTWFILSREQYVSARKEIGDIWRELIGNHYPPMSLVFVSGLLEERALLEIEAMAVIPIHPV